MDLNSFYTCIHSRVEHFSGFPVQQKKERKGWQVFPMSCLGLDDSNFFVFVYYYFLLASTLYFVKLLYFVITESL